MADNPYINKVQMADGTVLVDLTEDTVTSDQMLEGFTAHTCSGAITTGSIQTYNGDYVVNT